MVNIGRAMPEKNQNEIIQELNQVKRELAEVQDTINKINKQRLNYPLDKNSKEIIRRTYKEFLPKDIMELVWNEYIYVFDFPIVIDGASFLGNWNMGGSGVAFRGSSDGVGIEVGDTSGDYGILVKSPDIQDVFRWDKRQRFRTAFKLDFVSSVTAYTSRGSQDDNFSYGFKINDGTLYGYYDTSGNSGTSEVTTEVMSISGGTIYTVEARFNPNDGKITFYVKNTTTEKYEQVGSLVSDFPLGETTSSNLAEFKVTTNTNADRTLDVSWFEYIQKR